MRVRVCMRVRMIVRTPRATREEHTTGTQDTTGTHHHKREEHRQTKFAIIGRSKRKYRKKVKKNLEITKKAVTL